MTQEGKQVIDVVAASTGVMSMVAWLPPLASIFTIIWLAIRIYETDTVKKLIDRKQKVNKYIKEIGKIAGIDNSIEILEYKGLAKEKRITPKYNLICTHTARRSAATNMLLSGMKPFEVMKITGHKTEKDFFKYIRVSNEESAKNIKGNAYFNG